MDGMEGKEGWAWGLCIGRDVAAMVCGVALGARHSPCTKRAIPSGAPRAWSRDGMDGGESRKTLQRRQLCSRADPCLLPVFLYALCEQRSPFEAPAKGTNYMRLGMIAAASVAICGAALLAMPQENVAVVRLPALLVVVRPKHGTQ